MAGHLVRRSVVFAVLTSACASGVGDAGAAAPEGGRLDCRNPIGAATKPPSWLQTIDGAIALQTATTKVRKPALQAEQSASARPPGFGYFANTPVYVRTNGKQATVTVPRSERGRLSMTWGNPTPNDVSSRTYQVGPCQSDARWIVFPGGYYVIERDCYALRVRVGRHVTPVHVGIGAPCRGQDPPPV